MEPTPASYASQTLARQMVLWLLMISICLLFGSISAAFIQTPADTEIAIPTIFYVNTAFLLVSSILLHVSWLRREAPISRRLLRLTLGLGGGFLVGQSWGWVQMAKAAMEHTHIDYLYVLTGLHAIHLIAGLIFLLYVYHRPQKVNLQEMATYFWHFLGVLWVYLLIILIVYLGK